MMFREKTVLITGASRGIGKAIGLRLAGEGANIVVTGKTVDPHPRLPGTIHTAAEEMRQAGGQSIAVRMDIRDADQVSAAVKQAVDHFGGIDILINNASAIYLADIDTTPLKRYDLMHQVNVRGTYIATQRCLPYLRKSSNAHILTLSPPLDMHPGWFSSHLAYTMTKYGMSMCVLGLAEHLRSDDIAINALWPRTTIATAAVRNLLGGEEVIRRSRTPQIVADAAYFILSQSNPKPTGNFYIDEAVLVDNGVTDFDHYAVDPEYDLLDDLFIDNQPL